MQSKNKAAPTVAEDRHIQRVKGCDCAVCDARGPSEAHEIKQGQWWTSIALCGSCHRHSVFGIHGEKRMWIIKKIDELEALNITLFRCYGHIKTVPMAFAE